MEGKIFASVRAKSLSDYFSISCKALSWNVEMPKEIRLSEFVHQLEFDEYLQQL